MNAIGRCVEKFVISRTTKYTVGRQQRTQRGSDGKGLKNDTLCNLHTNISRRGIRQVNFRILFDRNGSQEPIFLNKGQTLAILSKKEGKDQESIQSSTMPALGYQWESDNFTIRHHKREPRGQPFPSR